AVRSAAVLGIEAYDVIVEVDAANGLPQFTIVGLPAGAGKESRERVGAALLNSGVAGPPRGSPGNLSPAGGRKGGPALELPVALGILVATKQLDARALQEIAAVGELGLDGALRAVRGALPMARRVARDAARTLVLPPANVAEAALVSAARLSAPASLAALVAALRNGGAPAAIVPPAAPAPDDTLDFADVAAQEGAKRALD